MALFGRKKKDEEQGAKPAENKQSNSVTEEMKVILAAREEEQQEKLAKAEERQQAQEEAAALKRKADKDIEMERARAMNELKDQISDAAVQIAGKIVEKEVRAEDHEKLIEAFIDKVGE